MFFFNGQGKNADLLSCYFGENPKNCTFEQGLAQNIKLIPLFVQYIRKWFIVYYIANITMFGD